MKRTLLGACLALTLGVAWLAAQDKPAPVKPTKADAQYVGCLVLGTEQNMYVLTNARPKDQRNDPPRTYRLASAVEDMDFMRHLNNEVEVSGTVVPVDPPKPGKPAEIPVLAAKAITQLADQCTNTR